MLNENMVQKDLVIDAIKCGIEVIHKVPRLKVIEKNGDLYFKPTENFEMKISEHEIHYCYFKIGSYQIRGEKWGDKGFFIQPFDDFETLHETETFDEAVKWCRSN